MPASSRDPGLPSGPDSISCQTQDAIEIFRLSVEQFPGSYNTSDSLADAYMDNGDEQLTIQNYRKSLEVNPKNMNALDKLKELTAP